MNGLKISKISLTDKFTYYSSNFKVMNRFNIAERWISFFVFSLSFLSACEPAILFTQSQPADQNPAKEIPERFLGEYIPVDETEEKKIQEIFGPWLIISRDSIVMLDYDTRQLHKNFVDGVSYSVKDGHIFRDDSCLSVFPARLRGGYYHYVHEIDSVIFLLSLGRYIQIKAQTLLFP